MTGFLTNLFFICSIRVVLKLQFLNNNRLKPAKCGAFCKTCLATNRVVKQAYYETERL
jgi:hypothetical protein